MSAPFIVHRDAVEASEGRYPAPFAAEALSLGRDLGRAAGSARIGVWEEVLAPGRRTSRAHAHSREEEAVYVLAGAPTLRWAPPGGAFVEEPLRAGSFLSFPAGTGIAHTIVNPGPAEAVLLVIGERNLADRVAYPEDPDLSAWRRAHRPHRDWDGVPGIPWPARVETPRLLLRPWRPDEARALHALALANRDHLLPWMPWAWKIPDLSSYLRMIIDWTKLGLDQRELIFGLFLPDGQPIGNVGLHPRGGPGSLEVGYWIAQEHGGQGYVTEAAGALTQVGLALMGLHRIDLLHHPDNHRSEAVARRLGFTHEGTLSRRVPDGRGGHHDVKVWALHADALATSPVAALPVRAYDLLDRRLVAAGPEGV